MSRQVLTQKIVNKMNKHQIAGTTAPAVPDPYRDRLLKLIPAEVVSVYLAVFQVMKAQSKTSETFYYLVFGLLLVGNILYKWRAGVTDWVEFLISSIAFVLWVFSVGGPVPDQAFLGINMQTYMPVLVPLFTFFLPLVYK